MQEDTKCWKWTEARPRGVDRKERGKWRIILKEKQSRRRCEEEIERTRKARLLEK